MIFPCFHVRSENPIFGSTSCVLESSSSTRQCRQKLNRFFSLRFPSFCVFLYLAATFSSFHGLGKFPMQDSQVWPREIRETMNGAFLPTLRWHLNETIFRPLFHFGLLNVKHASYWYGIAFYLWPSLLYLFEENALFREMQRVELGDYATNIPTLLMTAW